MTNQPSTRSLARTAVILGLALACVELAPAQALMGVYTVDSNVATTFPVGTNFANLAAAKAALDANGVGGSVTFDLYQRSAADFTTGIAWRPLVNAAGLWGGQAILTLDEWAGVSATKRVTFRAAAGETVVFDCGVNGIGVGVFFQGADHVVIENIEIQNAAFDGVSLYGESQMQSSPKDAAMDDDIIRRCRIHNCGGAGILIYGNPSQPRNISIENNFLWNNLTGTTDFFNQVARFGQISGRRHSGVSIRHNSLFQSVAMSNLFTVGTTTIPSPLTPCMIGSNSNAGAQFSDCSDNVLEISGVAGSVPAGFYRWQITPALKNQPLASDRNVYFDATGAAPFATVYNVSKPTALAYHTAFPAFDLTSQVADPLFVSPAFGNLDIPAGSPCVDTDPSSSSPVTIDIHGAPRTGVGADAGAAEAPLPGLVAAFISDVTTGACPLVVGFSDLSVAGMNGPITSWAWDFDGDSIIDSTMQNPAFTYTVPGTYTVSLTVGDGTSFVTRTVTALIVAGPYTLNVTTTGGDLAIYGVPQIGVPTAASGYTLLSLTTPPVVGTGTFLGITFDSYTLIPLTHPATVGDPLHFSMGFAGAFPEVPFLLGPNALYLIGFTPGQMIDWVQVYLDGSGNFAFVTNVVRITA